MKKIFAGLALVFLVSAAIPSAVAELSFWERRALQQEEAQEQAMFEQLLAEEQEPTCGIICQDKGKTLQQEIAGIKLEIAAAIGPIRDTSGERPTQAPAASPAPEKITVEAPQIKEGLLLNPSIESSDGQGNPSFWTGSSWGNNKHQFIYDDTRACTGKYSARVKISDLTDGDAKWASDPISVGEKRKLNVSDWYRSDTQTEMVLGATASNSTVQYLFLKEAPPAEQWTNYADNATLPDDTVSVIIFHVLEKPG